MSFQCVLIIYHFLEVIDRTGFGLPFYPYNFFLKFAQCPFDNQWFFSQKLQITILYEIFVNAEQIADEVMTSFSQNFSSHNSCLLTQKFSII